MSSLNDVYPNKTNVYVGGWKSWKKPSAYVSGSWKDAKKAWVFKDGAWVLVWDAIAAGTFPKPPVATVSNEGVDSDVTVNWDAVPQATSYNVYNVDGTAITTNTAVTSFKDTNPQDGKAGYKVEANLPGDYGNTEAISNVLTLAQAPTSLKAVGGDGFHDWSLASAGHHDDVQALVNGVVVETMPAGTTERWFDGDMDPGTVSAITVRTRISGNNGPLSNEVNTPSVAQIPTSVTAEATTTKGQVKLSWGHPAGSRTGYQVQANDGGWVNVSDTTSPSYHTFSGSSGSKSMRVRTLSAGGSSAYVSASATPVWLYAPNVPSSVSIAATTTVGQLKLTWSAPTSGDAAASYQVQTSTNNSSWTTASSSASSPYTHSFGSSGSGARYMRVKAVNSAGSSGYVSKTGTPLWDLPAPSAPTVSKFGPKTSYGRMELTFKTSSANNSQYRVAFKVGSGSWTYGNWTNVGNNTTKTVHVGTASNANQTVYSFVDCKNSTGQSTRSTQANYVLHGSPFYWQPQASGHYRSGKYGQNTDNHNRPYMGYYSNSAYNYDGLWFYGHNAFKNFMTTSGTHKPATYRVPTVWRVTMVRNGGGNNQSDAVYVGTHTSATKPANLTAGAGAHVVYDVVHLGNLKYGESFNADVPASLYNNLINGSRQGFGVATGSGKPYMYMYSVAENGFSGWVHVEHLG